MSFHLNLSSSEDEDAFDEDDQRESSAVSGGLAAASIFGGGRSGDEETEEPRLSTAEASSSPPLGSSSIGAGTFAWGDESDDDDEGVDWEDVDAVDDNEFGHGTTNQDASPDDRGVLVGSKRKMPTRDITIDFGGDEKKQEEEDENKEGKQKTKRRKRRLNKIQNLPPQLANLVLNIHRSHMLALSGRAIYVSNCCSNDELMHLAHSLIPAEIMDSCFSCTQTNEPIVPSEVQVRQVLAWFFDLVHDVSQRRRRIRDNNAALGAPQQQQPRQRVATRGRRGRGDSRGGNRGRWGATRNTQNDETYINEGVGSTDERRLMALLQYLSPTNDEDPAFDDEEQRNTIGGAATSHEKTEILILVLRSLRWRVRYVTAMQPVTRELTVNHPLFATSLKDVFHRVMESGSNRALRKKAKSLEKKGSASQNNDRVDCGETAEGSGSILAWVELLYKPVSRCKGASTAAINGAEGSGGGTSAARWVHVDVERRVVDQPSVIETLLARLTDDRQESASTKSFRGSGARSKARVSYVLAAEHTKLESTADTTHGSMHAFCRLTDVTRRYSGVWSETLRLRGATGQQIVSNGGKCVDSWWANTVRKTNRLAKRQARNFLSQHQANAKEDNEKKMSPRIASSKAGSDSCEAVVIDDSSDSEREGNATASVASAAHLLEKDAHADAEKAELAASTADEAIPTSKAAFKKHPLYAVPSILNQTEVIHPSGKKRVVGIFKGELVYRRTDVSTALTAKQWLYQGRKVKDAELPKPAKKVKARQKPAPKTFKALTSYGVSDNTEQKVDGAAIEEEYDGMDKLYGKWQTDQWSPPSVGPNDTIPVNEYRNVEKALMNPGLVHLELTRISQVAKKLGIPYAPCLLGFEGHRGNRTPTIRGIVVHEHNADLLREAHTEWESQAVEQEHEQRRKAVYKRWKRLIVGILTKERLERQYGDCE